MMTNDDRRFADRILRRCPEGGQISVPYSRNGLAVKALEAAGMRVVASSTVSVAGRGDYACTTLTR